MKEADELLAEYARTRDLRDKIQTARDACLCERHEGVDEHMEMRSGEPCWKAARHWSHDEEGQRAGFYLDPPISEWCQSCRQRQAYTEQLRAEVRSHAAAKRAILARGRAIQRHRYLASILNTNPVCPEVLSHG